MKRGFFLLPVLLLGASITSHAFTLDIVSHEFAELCQGPRSISVHGYGEVVFSSGLDGVLVVDSAYASTNRIEIPPSSGELALEPPIDDTAAGADPDFVEIANRTSSDLSSPLQITLHPAGSALLNPPDGWNAVPETASATLGLVGTLMLLLRRRGKTMSPAEESSDPPGVFNPHLSPLNTLQAFWNRPRFRP